MHILSVIFALVLVFVPAAASAVSVGGDVNVNVNATSSSGSGGAGINMGVGATTSAGARSGTTSGNSGTVRTEFRTNPAGIIVISAAQVSSQADLEVFIENAPLNNENVAKVDMSADDRMVVEYRHHGRLFGIFPVTVKSKTSVSAEEDGSLMVETRLPWWSGFVTGVGKTRAAVEERLNASTSLEAAFSASASAEARARAAEEVIAALDASASASGSSSAQVQ